MSGHARSATISASRTGPARRAPGLRPTFPAAAAVVVLVVMAVVARVVVPVAIEVDAVQHRADRLRLARREGFDRALGMRPPRHLRSDHEDDARDAARHDDGVGHRQHRRRVDDHPVERARCAGAPSSAFIRSDDSSSDGLGGMRPAEITNRFGSLGFLHRVADARLTDEQVRQPDLVLRADHRVQAGTPHVGVDEQHARAAERQHHARGCTPSSSCPRAAGCSSRR